MQHPKSPKEITREWIAFVFQETGLCSEDAIAGIDIQPLGPHVKGLLSSFCRVNINYKSPVQNLPRSVVIKFPPDKDENKSFGSNWGVYEREVRFYRELAPKSPIRVPKCYYTVQDDSNYEFLLMLEDAGDWIEGDQVRGLTINQTKSAIEAIAKFHAYWWGSKELVDLKWMPIENRNPLHAFHESWENFREEHKDVLDSPDIEAGNLIAQNGPKIEALSQIGPRTIIHYDFRADNMMFDEKDQIMVVDWQTAVISFGAFDVGRAVCGSHYGVLGKSRHMELLKLWHQVLLDCGVDNYTLEEAWRDYRIGIILSSYVPVCAHHFLSHEGSRGTAVLKAMIKRIFYAFHECQVLELIK